MHSFLRLVGVAVALLGSSLVPVQAQTLLRWKMQPNETLHYVVGQDVTTTFDLNNQPVRVVVNQQLESTWQVEAVDAEGTFTFSQTIDRVRVKLEQDNQPAIEYDSASKEEPQGLLKALASMFGVLVDKPMAIKMTSRGEVVDFKFPPDVLEKLKQLPGGAQFGNLLSEQGMRQMLDVMALPHEAVTPGKSWQRHSEVTPPGVGKEDIDSTLTYVGPETKDGREFEKLDVDVTMKFTPGEKQQATLEIKDQNTDGAIYFDNAAGRLEQSAATTKLVLGVSLAGSTVVQNMQIASHMKLVPKQ